jgi:SAM-dependent methyltransferase
MSKHNLLTVQEINNYKLRSQLLKLIETTARKLGVPLSSLRVLDWGCGRGNTVIKLLQMGIDAYGVDVDSVPINNGLPVMKELGFDDQKRLFQINLDCKTPFEDGFFHVILSDQVFEHVSNFEALTSELSRLTCSQGEGLHFFPSKWCYIEPHLLIPIVHWLPKNILRFWWIRLMINKIPIWKELENTSINDRSETYYKYMLQKTYYRSLPKIKNTLKNRQFEVDLYPCIPPNRNNKIQLLLIKIGNFFSLNFWNWYTNTFKSVILRTIRK